MVCHWSGRYRCGIGNGRDTTVSWNSKPFQQAKLSPEEAAVFNGDRIAGSGLQFSQLTPRVNILLLGTGVLPPDHQTWQAEILRIWDYLLGQSGNGRQGS